MGVGSLSRTCLWDCNSEMDRPVMIGLLVGLFGWVFDCFEIVFLNFKLLL